MDSDSITDVVVLMLPLYVSALTQLLAQGADLVTSQQLGTLLQMTPAQIRKDLSYFGMFGKQGRGYNVRFLYEELRQILGLNQRWPACLIGIGRLGQAIINYPGFVPEGFSIVAIFDNDPEMVGQTLSGVKVRPMSELSRGVQDEDISIGIVAVPSREAQSVIDGLVDLGIKGILNYAPIAPEVPSSVVIRNIDPVLSLQSMTFYLLRDHGPPP